jgi:phage gpG-like protein
VATFELKGNTAGLGRLLASVKRLQGAEMRNRLAKVVAAEALAQTLLGFEASRDPYGKAWKALRVRHGQPLLDTGRLRNSLHTYTSGTLAGVATDVKYAPIHQAGGVIRPVRAKALRFKGPKGWIFTKGPVTIPARPFFPTRGLPRAWLREFEAVAGDFLRRRAKVGA